ncbi:MAG: YsnF/AvaK domain-containing protein [Cytophagales bacterium]|nr:YsnF/AvaK domain-containing protein [Armatimonadota bacterium]
MTGAATAAAGFGGERITVPVIEESVEIHKRVVETSGIRIVKTVTEREEIIEEPLGREQVEVTRVPAGRIVEAAVAPRQEGDTLIIPIYEERLVVQKQLFLIEELHVTRNRIVDRREQQTVTLRREEVAVERFPIDSAPGGIGDSDTPR